MEEKEKVEEPVEDDKMGIQIDKDTGVSEIMRDVKLWRVGGKLRRRVEEELEYTDEYMAGVLYSFQSTKKNLIFQKAQEFYKISSALDKIRVLNRKIKEKKGVIIKLKRKNWLGDMLIPIVGSPIPTTNMRKRPRTPRTPIMV